MGSATTSAKAKRPPIAVTSVKIEQELLDQFKEVAAANRRSVSGEIRWIIERHIEAHRSTS